MKWTPIPDQKTREEYIERVLDMFEAEGLTLTVDEANRHAERLYHLDNDDWLSEYKEQREMELINNH